MAVDKLRAQSKLAFVITQELAYGDKDGDDRLSPSECGLVNGFIRQHIAGGDNTLEAIKDRTLRDALVIWAKHNTSNKKQLSDAEINAITEEDPLLGELTQRAVALAKGKTQPSDQVTLGTLPASHQLKQLADEIASEWGASNLSSGRIVVSSGRIVGFAQIDKSTGDEKREATLRASAVKIFKSTYETTEETTIEKNKQGMQYGEWEPALRAMMKAVAADGFSYAPENTEARAALEKQLTKMITASGARFPIVCEVKDKLYSPALDKKVNVSTFLISDIDSGEYIAIYVRQGLM